jgi:NitT/TauT family transport system substrate-binding protein
MTDGQIAFSIDKLKTSGLVDSGAAVDGGIGCLSLDQVKSFYDKMVDAGAVKADIDYQKVVTDKFVCKKVGMDLKK